MALKSDNYCTARVVQLLHCKRVPEISVLSDRNKFLYYDLLSLDVYSIIVCKEGVASLGGKNASGGVEKFRSGQYWVLDESRVPKVVASERKDRPRSFARGSVVFFIDKRLAYRVRLSGLFCGPWMVPKIWGNPMTARRMQSAYPINASFWLCLADHRNKACRDEPSAVPELLVCPYLLRSSIVHKVSHQPLLCCS